MSQEIDDDTLIKIAKLMVADLERGDFAYAATRATFLAFELIRRPEGQTLDNLLRDPESEFPTLGEVVKFERENASRGPLITDQFREDSADDFDDEFLNSMMIDAKQDHRLNVAGALLEEIKRRHEPEDVDRVISLFSAVK